MTFASFVDLGLSRAQERGQELVFTFLRDNGTEASSMTFGQLDQRARAIGAALHERGAQQRPVLVLLPPGPQYVTAIIGCFYAGSIAVPCYPARSNQPPARLQAIATDSRATVALCGGALPLDMPERPRLPAGLGELHWLSVDSIADGQSAAWRHPHVTETCAAMIQYTSGSTGQPKGVVLTHRNLLHNSERIFTSFGHCAESRLVSWLPCYHDMGLIGSVFQPLYGGFHAVHLNPAAFVQRPIRWLEAITRYGATVSGGPNFAYDLCVETTSEEQRATLDLSSWELAYCGAEPVRPHTLRNFAAAFEPSGFRWRSWYPCYGLAEATLLTTGGEKCAGPVIRRFQREALEQDRVVEALPGTEGARELVACGRGLPDQELLIVDPATLEEKGPDRVGEIWLSGASIAAGYWKRGLETAATFQARERSRRGPFLRTGDLGFLHDGQVYISGRAKDLIVIDGVNHSPSDIEATSAACHAALRGFAGAAFSGHEDRSGIVLLQEVYRRMPPELHREVVNAIRRAIAEQHGLRAQTVRLLSAGALPRTSSGKIMRGEARARFLHDRFRYLDAEMSAEPLLPGRP